MSTHDRQQDARVDATLCVHEKRKKEEKKRRKKKNEQKRTLLHAKAALFQRKDADVCFTFFSSGVGGLECRKTVSLY